MPLSHSCFRSLNFADSLLSPADDVAVISPSKSMICPMRGRLPGFAAWQEQVDSCLVSSRFSAEREERIAKAWWKSIPCEDADML